MKYFACVAFALLGCSSALQDVNPLPEKEAYCDLRPGKDQCTDLRKFKGASLVTFQGVCDTLKASSKNATGYKEDATCPTTNMLGGCQTENGDGSLQTNWYYTGDTYKTVDDVKKQCTDDKTTFVNPS